LAQDQLFRVRLIIPDLDVLHGLDVDNGCMPIRKRQDGQIEMEAIVPQTTLTRLQAMKAQNVSVEMLGDLSAEVKISAKMFSRTNRYADGSLPRGLGKPEGK
jgi:hypothetical protein